MATNPNPNAIPGLDDPARTRRPVRRHALNLPAGSVRALLALMVLGLLAAIVLLEKQNDAPLLFLYLQYLMFLILAHFFAAHGTSIGASHLGERHPLGLPAGSVRFLLLIGFAALAAWLFYTKPSFEDWPRVSMVPALVLLSGFLVGLVVAYVIRRPLLARGGVPGWMQDLEAWVALLAMIGLVVELLLQVFILPSLSPEQRFDPTPWEHILAAIIGFYFGARS